MADFTQQLAKMVEAAKPMYRGGGSPGVSAGGPASGNFKATPDNNIGTGFGQAAGGYAGKRFMQAFDPETIKRAAAKEHEMFQGIKDPKLQALVIRSPIYQDKLQRYKGAGYGNITDAGALFGPEFKGKLAFTTSPMTSEARADLQERGTGKSRVAQEATDVSAGRRASTAGTVQQVEQEGQMFDLKQSQIQETIKQIQAQTKILESETDPVKLLQAKELQKKQIDKLNADINSAQESLAQSRKLFIPGLRQEEAAASSAESQARVDLETESGRVYATEQAEEAREIALDAARMNITVSQAQVDQMQAATQNYFNKLSHEMNKALAKDTREQAKGINTTRRDQEKLFAKEYQNLTEPKAYELAMKQLNATAGVVTAFGTENVPFQKPDGGTGYLSAPGALMSEVGMQWVRKDIGEAYTAFKLAEKAEDKTQMKQLADMSYNLYDSVFQKVSSEDIKKSELISNRYAVAGEIQQMAFYMQYWANHERYTQSADPEELKQGAALKQVIGDKAPPPSGSFGWLRDAGIWVWGAGRATLTPVWNLISGTAPGGE